MTSESRRFQETRHTDNSQECPSGRPSSPSRDFTQILRGHSHQITEAGSPIHNLEVAWKETVEWSQKRQELKNTTNEYLTCIEKGYLHYVTGAIDNGKTSFIFTEDGSRILNEIDNFNINELSDQRAKDTVTEVERTICSIYTDIYDIPENDILNSYIDSLNKTPLSEELRNKTETFFLRAKNIKNIVKSYLDKIHESRIEVHINKLNADIEENNIKNSIKGQQPNLPKLPLRRYIEGTIVSRLESAVYGTNLEECDPDILDLDYLARQIGIGKMIEE